MAGHEAQGAQGTGYADGAQGLDLVAGADDGHDGDDDDAEVEDAPRLPEEGLRPAEDASGDHLDDELQRKVGGDDDVGHGQVSGQRPAVVRV